MKRALVVLIGAILFISIPAYGSPLTPASGPCSITEESFTGETPVVEKFRPECISVAGQWAFNLISYLGGTPTKTSIGMVIAWQNKENTPARWNPLAVATAPPTVHPRCRGDFNSHGVQQCDDAAASIELATKILGQYPSARRAILDSNPSALWAAPGACSYASCGYFREMGRIYDTEVAPNFFVKANEVMRSAPEGPPVELPKLDHKSRLGGVILGTNFRVASLTFSIAIGLLMLVKSLKLSPFTRVWNCLGIGIGTALVDQVSNSWSLETIVTDFGKSIRTTGPRIGFELGILASVIALGLVVLSRKYDLSRGFDILRGTLIVLWGRTVPLVPYLSIATIPLFLTFDRTADSWYVALASGGWLGLTLCWSLFGWPRKQVSKYMVRA